MTTEDIQKRIEEAKIRHTERMVPMLEKKKQEKELSRSMKERGIVLSYIDVPYATFESKYESVDRLFAKVSVATKREESETEGKTKLVIAYAILSEKDNFSKAIARTILNERLETPTAKQRIVIEVTEKAVDNSEKMYDIINKAVKLELVSNTDTVPAWLYKGMKTEEEVIENLF